jgi:hypothetical protein
VGALSTDQISALDSTQIAAISVAAIKGLKAAQMTAMDVEDIAALTPKQVASLIPVQIAALSEEKIQAISEVCMGALTAAQVPGLSAVQITALTNNQIGAFSTAGLGALNVKQVQAIDVADLAALSSTQMAALKAIQVAALSTDQIGALDGTQIAAISVAAMKGLTATQMTMMSREDIASLTTKQVASLNTKQIQALTAEQLSALTEGQIASLTTPQVKAFTPEQVAIITDLQIPYLNMITPIILDLNGDGVKTQSINAGVKFDLLADGRAVHTGWVSDGDGLLVLDRNHDGLITDGSELFGSATKLAHGENASDGYAALRELDTNSDLAINSEDECFADLRVWTDTNSNAITDAGEIKTLASLGIASISLDTAQGTSTDNGNVLGLTSTYQTNDGQSHAAADVWFAADTLGVNHAGSALINKIAENDTTSKALVAVASAGSMNSNPDALIRPIPVPQQVDNVLNVAQADLRTKVGVMVQTMGAFMNASLMSTSELDTPINREAPVLNGSAVVTTAPTLVASMNDAMDQFYANGRSGASALSMATPSAKSLTAMSLLKPMDNSIIAVDAKI